jgi:spore coat polysaccharide biosynthesis protein SpsF
VSVLAVVQARMSSTRLPGKVMRPLLGEPMIARQLARLARCREIDRLVVATSDRPDDDVLAAEVARLGVAVHRGSLDDVLGRFAGALKGFGPAEAIVRLTADCPLADPQVIDACIRLQRETGADYASNALKRTYPRGLDVEVIRAGALAEAAAEAADLYEREHVTPFIYRRPERYRLADLTGPADLSRLRWTVDTPADFAFVEDVYARLHPSKPDFTSADVLALPITHLEAA